MGSLEGHDGDCFSAMTYIYRLKSWCVMIVNISAIPLCNAGNTTYLWYWWTEKGISNTYSLYSWVQIWHNMKLSSLKDLTWNDKDDLSATYSTLCAWALAEISRNIRAFKRSQDTQSTLIWLSGFREKGFATGISNGEEFQENCLQI